MHEFMNTAKLHLKYNFFPRNTQQEIEKVLSMGVSPERIIFANPCKMISHIKYAEKCGVKKMTVDRENELHKVKQYFENAE